MGIIKRKRLDQIFNDLLNPENFIVKGFVFVFRQEGGYSAPYLISENVRDYDLIVCKNVMTGNSGTYDIDWIYENGYEATQLERELYGLS